MPALSTPHVHEKCGRLYNYHDRSVLGVRKLRNFLTIARKLHNLHNLHTIAYVIASLYIRLMAVVLLPLCVYHLIFELVFYSYTTAKI